MSPTSALPGSAPRPPTAGLLAELVVASAAAALATQVKVLAEGALQPLAERLFPPSDQQRTLRGADPAGHPHDMPPQVLVDRIGDELTGEPPSDAVRETTSQAVHWVLGVGSGLAYGLLGRRLPWVRAGHGVGFGAVLFAATHGSLLPAIGIQAPLTRQPGSWWVWEPGSHLVFGLTTDLALSLGDAVRARLADN